MGRHRVSATQVGCMGSLAVALGIGAAVAGGAGVANAEVSGDDGPGASPKKPAASDSGTSGTGPNEAADHKSAADGTPKTKVSATGGLAGLAQRVVAALDSGGSASQGKQSTTGATTHSTTVTGGRSSTTTHGTLTATASPAKPADTLAKATSAPAIPNASPAAPNASPALRNSAPAAPEPAPKPDPVTTLASNVVNALGVTSTATKPSPPPVTPAPPLLGGLQLVRREIELATLNLTSPTPRVTPVQPNAQPSTATAAPTPADETPTPYGNVGKWMLQSNGQISNYGGQPYGGKTLLEPVNVIIVDPRSKSPEEAAARLNGAMFWSGFPAQPIHSTGFRGTIDEVTYSQQPTGPLLGYSDNSFLLPNDHGRIFGPDPVQTNKGYVWSGAFSSEQLGLYGLLPTHTYVSSNAARTALATRLIMSGQATYGGVVPLNNAYSTDTTTTGDHDGYAVVLVLR